MVMEYLVINKTSIIYHTVLNSMLMEFLVINKTSIIYHTVLNSILMEFLVINKTSIIYHTVLNSMLMEFLVINKTSIIYHTVLNVLFITNVPSFNVNNGISLDNKVFWQYLNNIVLSWPEDGRLTAETCQV